MRAKYTASNVENIAREIEWLEEHLTETISDNVEEAMEYIYPGYTGMEDMWNIYDEEL